jgi:hypothetical protein
VQPRPGLQLQREGEVLEAGTLHRVPIVPVQRWQRLLLLLLLLLAAHRPIVLREGEPGDLGDRLRQVFRAVGGRDREGRKARRRRRRVRHVQEQLEQRPRQLLRVRGDGGGARSRGCHLVSL